VTAAAVAMWASLPCRTTATGRLVRPRLHVVEDLVVSAVIAAMVLVPLTESVLRHAFQLMPVLLQARYSEKDALGLVTGAGPLGMLLPPCLPLIVYAIVARVPIIVVLHIGVLLITYVPALTTALPRLFRY
jgi:TRAP-type C4-dicarboxylate transport system permease large subunit